MFIFSQAIVNALSQRDRVLSLTHGVFSERFASLAETIGMQVQKLSFPLCEGVDPQKVSEVLQADEEKKMSNTQRYKQCGNAVTVDVVQAIAEKIKPLFK